jgi:hypothetical protein
MKTSMRYLGFIAAAAATSAFAAEEPPLPKISDNNTAAVAPSPAVSQQISASLPKYDPQAAAAAAEAAKTYAEPRPGDPVKETTREDISRAANPSDADLLVLPKMTVKQKPRPRLTEDVVYKDKKDFGAIFAKQNYTQLDQALNKFTLPLFGTSLEARAYDDYMRQKNEQVKSDVNALAKAVEQTDAAEAKALRDAMAKP